MKLYSTTDISASVHKASEQFTHVVVNRAYALHNPVFFDSRVLLDLPLFQYASWLPTERQLSNWQERGGVLVEQDRYPKTDIESDVTVMIECPYNMARIDLLSKRNKEYAVIPNPVQWATHEDCVDLNFPVPELLREIWSVCAGKEMTNSEIAQAVDMPVSQIAYLKKSLQPVEMWHIHKRLAPEREEFIPAWDWLESGTKRRSEITNAGFRSQIEEMARFGYIQLKKMNKFPSEEPNWKQVGKDREAALKDLAAVRLLVESLPTHPET